MKRRWLIKDKNGQFYLVSAIIISVLIIGIIAVSNFSRSSESTNLQEIGKELSIESEKVFDSAIYNGVDTKQRMITFANDYINYVNKDDSYFIFGDGAGITVTAYSDISKTITLGGVSGDDTMILTAGQIKSQDFTPNSNDLILTIDGKSYGFELKDGKNFYFLIFSDIGGEKHAVRN